MHGPYRRRILILFFLSGVCALVYEITWMRMFRLVMGNTVFTTATVLTVFMGGLALGSYLAGRFLDRSPRLLLIYALLEGAIGAWALFMPSLFSFVEPAYRLAYRLLTDDPMALAVARFLISATLMIIPTTLMGATLPLLSRFFARTRERLGRDVGRLYAFNTLGAAVGAGLTGFLLVPIFGVGNSGLVAALGNVLICVLSLWLARVSGEIKPVVDLIQVRTSLLTSRHKGRAVLVGLAGAGFASMVYEVAWTRTLTMLIGSSVYAFTLMLVAFITGLGLGSMILSNWIDKWRHLWACLGALEILVGLAAMIVVPLLGEMPFYMVELVTKYAVSFAALHAVEFVTVFALMLGPTLAMGAIFPVVAKIYTPDLAGVGRTVGEAYAANTLGAVLGSFVGGFILIPSIGAQYSIVAAVCLNTAIGLYFVVTSQWANAVWRMNTAAATVAVLSVSIVFLPQWDPILLNSAPYLYAYRYKARSVSDMRGLSQVMTSNRRLLYAEEGITATVTVVESGGEIYLKVNGKTDASSRGDLRSQSLLAHLPLLLHDDPQQVLLVGLGSGISLGALERHPVANIQCVEISPEVVTAARFFSGVNYDATADPRLDLRIGDGRNHLDLGRRHFDVVISQPSNLWIAGMADLFTQEFFETGRQRLASGGVFCSWLQAYSMRDEDFKTILRTFASVFPQVSLWESVPGGDYFLIGTLAPHSVDWQVLKRRWIGRGLEPDFARIGVVSLENLLCSFVMDDLTLRRFVGPGLKNTDDNASLEFGAPYGMYLGLRGGEGLFGLASLVGERQSWPEFLDEYPSDELPRAWRARQAALEGSLSLDRRDFKAARRHLETAVAFDPGDMELRRVYPLLAQELTTKALDEGDFHGAVRLCRRAVEIVPEDGRSHFRLGRALQRLGEFLEARRAFDRAVQLEPRFVAAYMAMGEVSGSGERAVEAYRRVLQIEADHLGALAGLGGHFLRLRRSRKALDFFEKALAVAPTNAQVHNSIGLVHTQLGDFVSASNWFRRAVELSDGYVVALENLAESQLRLREWAAARATAERALKLAPGSLRAQEVLGQTDRDRL